MNWAEPGIPRQPLYHDDKKNLLSTVLGVLLALNSVLYDVMGNFVNTGNKIGQIQHSELDGKRRQYWRLSKGHEPREVER